MEIKDLIQRLGDILSILKKLIFRTKIRLELILQLVMLFNIID